MKIVSGFVAVVTALAVSGCNPTYIDYDYDVDVDFTQYKTFAWYEQSTMSEGKPQAVQQSSLFEARIKRAVNEGMTNKGLRLVESDSDLILAYHIGIDNITEIRSTGYGYGWGYGGGNTRADHFQEGTFILDMIDASTEKLVWRGIAEGVLDENPSPDKMDKDVQNTTERLLAKYPPPD